MNVLDSLVIGAGQAGLSSSHHLQRLGIEHVVVDADDAPGGAWQHRWDDLTMSDVHGVADLPGSAVPPAAGHERANTFVPAYFDAYEHEHDLPVVRPVHVSSVHDADGVLRVETAAAPAGVPGRGRQTSTAGVPGRGRQTSTAGVPGRGRPRTQHWLTRTLINATGTWTHPFIPRYPGAETFRGEQLHTARYPGAEHFRGRRVLVVGGGASAVQFLGQLRPVTETLWVTRREPVWRTEPFDPEAGREAVAMVTERVRQGLPPRSVVSVTGLMLRPQEAEAARLGAYRRLPMFERIEPTGIRWADGTHEPVDVILWATGFRPAIAHLAPLGLRSPRGGIQLDRVTAVADPRVQMVGYGPSASTIGANRGGRFAALGVRRTLRTLTPVTAQA